MSKPLPLDEQMLFNVIADHYKRYIEGDTSRIVYTIHAEQRRDQTNRNMSPLKVMDILKRPKGMPNEPRWDNKNKQWGYRIQGYNKRHIVISINKGYIEIITTF